MRDEIKSNEIEKDIIRYAISEVEAGIVLDDNQLDVESSCLEIIPKELDAEPDDMLIIHFGESTFVTIDLRLIRGVIKVLENWREKRKDS